MLRSPPGRPEDRRRRRRSPIAEAFGGSQLAGGIDAVNLKYALRKIKTDGGNLHGGGSSLWRHTTTTTLGTRCRSAGAVHPINSMVGSNLGQDQASRKRDVLGRSLKLAIESRRAKK